MYRVEVMLGLVWDVRVDLNAGNSERSNGMLLLFNAMKSGSFMKFLVFKFYL